MHNEAGYHVPFLQAFSTTEIPIIDRVAI